MSHPFAQALAARRKSRGPSAPKPPYVPSGAGGPPSPAPSTPQSGGFRDKLRAKMKTMGFGKSGAYCLLLFGLFLSLSHQAQATVNVSHTKLKYSDGRGIYGYAILQLPVPVKVTSTGETLAPDPIYANVVNGVMTTLTGLHGNDDLQPAKTYYNFRVYDTTGRLVAGLNVVIPDGGSYDLATAIPTNVQPTNIWYNSLLGLSALSVSGTTSVTFSVATAGTAFSVNQTGSGPIADFKLSGASKFTINNDGTLVIGKGVGPDAGGFKHKRGATCTTAASVGSLCTTTITWTTPFADSNYSVTCSVHDSTGAEVRLDQAGAAKTAANMVIKIEATAAVASSTFYDCWAVHD